MKKALFLIASVAILFAGCSQIDDLDSRLKKVESEVASLTSQFSTLQQLVDALNGKIFVNSVTDNKDGSYTINFSNNTSATIKDGAKGDPGDNGADGVTPQFKIEEGKWFVSFDEGKSWKELGQATGDKGADGTSIYDKVEVGQDSITITLVDGTSITLPVYRAANAIEMLTSVVYVPDNREGDVQLEVPAMTLAVTYDIYPKAALSLISGDDYKKSLLFIGFDEATEQVEVELGGDAAVVEYGLSDDRCSVKVRLLNAPASLLKGDYQVSLKISYGDDVFCSPFANVANKFTPLIIGGDEYKYAAMPDGKLWMTEPLHYVWTGATVSDDPSDATATIFYPYEITKCYNDTTFKKDGTVSSITVKGEAAPLKDAASIKAKGLFYTYEAIFGEPITDNNYYTFEGKQGICPDGWHIPTRDDWYGLIGNSLKAYGDAAAPADNPSAPFYDAKYKGSKVSIMNEAGFNFVLGGAVSVATARTYGNTAISEYNCSVPEYYGNPTMAYVASSTGSSSKSMFMSVATTFTNAYPEGRVSIMSAKAATGCQVRCVK